MTQKNQIPGAVALRYDPKAGRAPRVTARGKGDLAEKIIDLARKNNIEIHQDPDLFRMLSRLDLNSEIPPVLYEVVAELLSFVYLLNDRESKK
jgi:flagellar biosynthesis protein